MKTRKPARAAREKLLQAADELFYRDGVHAVGVDTVVEQADVAKASLYNIFHSKDGLIEAYLDRRQEQRAEWIGDVLERFGTPRERMLGIFEVLRLRLELNDYRGCAFINAGVQSPPGGHVQMAMDGYRAWLRGIFETQAKLAGAADPKALARQLTVLYEGAAVGGRLDRNVAAATAAKEAAAILIDAATA